MRTVKIENLSVGMVTGEPVRTRSGQIIVRQGASLTNQMINHLNYYNIKEAKVLSGDELDAYEYASNPDIISYQQRIQNSVEFKHFKKAFTEKVDYLKTYMNDVILKNEVIDEHDLLEETLDLFRQTANSANIFEMLHCLRKIDDSTYSHSVNVAIIARMMGQWLKFSREDIDALTLAGLLHDIGKCKIPHTIIGKPGKLTHEEFNVIKQHPQGGYSLIKSQVLDARIKRAALMHHERCDGSGYPIGLLGEDIDDFAIIVSIADVYDAMTTNRCYRDALCPFEVITTFEREGFNKYKALYISTFLEHIVDTYMNEHVILNDGSKGQIVLKNREQLARPTIYLQNKEFLDLSKHPDLFIQAII